MMSIFKKKNKPDFVKVYNSDGDIYIKTVLILKKFNKKTYFRARAGILYVTYNKQINEAGIKKYIVKNFEQLYTSILKSDSAKTKNEEFMLFGEFYKIQLGYADVFSYELDVENKIIIIKYNPKEEISDIYDRILILELTQKILDVEPIIKERLAIVGLDSVPVKVKKLRSKYGSCHLIKKVITISSFMAKINQNYLIYLLFHEYSHLLVPNHSKAFHELLEKLYPKHRLIERSLNKIAIVY